MDAYVKRQMMCQTIQYKKRLGVDGDGTMQYDEDFSTFKAYQTGRKINLILNESEEVLSTVQFFVDEKTVLLFNEGDLVQPLHYTETYPIRKIEYYYKERGILDYGILYLA